MKTRLAILALTTAVLTPGVNAQAPCPVALLSAKPVKDGLQVDFRNNGKVPLEQLSLGCLPSGANRFPNGICHVETGIFYPSTVSTIKIDYVGAGQRPIEISVASLRLNGGTLWEPNAGNRCKNLRVPGRK
jgi:hypothetical protein